MANGELTAYRLQTNHPFSMEAKATPLMGVLLARCDGTATGREHYVSLRDAKAFPDRESGRIRSAAWQLASGGFILIPGFEPSQ